MRTICRRGSPCTPAIPPAAGFLLHALTPYTHRRRRTSSRTRRPSSISGARRRMRSAQSSLRTGTSTGTRPLRVHICILMVPQPAASRAPFGTTGLPPLLSNTTSPSAITICDRDMHQVLFHHMSIPMLRTKARLKPRRSTTRITTRGSALKHHCTTSPFSATPLLTPARESGQLFRGRVAILGLSFLYFFDCGDAELWGFSLACFDARGSVERTFPCMGGMSFCEADAEVLCRGPALAWGCMNGAPAFFDAL
ncbi:hypothetical protein C8J57DRAFT_634271 [Mycena rebaudengoi]|nr:hypothetical protein C8J57DRAFT_634271 [Mycena rebaudengoi]